MIRFSELMNMVFLTGAAVALLWLVCRNNRAILWLDVRLLMGCMLRDWVWKPAGPMGKSEGCVQRHFQRLPETPPLRIAF